MKMNIPIIDKVTVGLSAGSTRRYQHKTTHRFSWRLIHITLIALLLITVVSGVNLIVLCSRSVTVEVGDIPDYSHITSNGFTSLICQIDTDISSIDTSKPTETEILLLFFGFIKFRSTLNVVDTVKPKIKPQNICVTVGTDIIGEMFARETNDRTQVNFNIISAVNSSVACKNEYVSISAIDEGGNRVEYKAKLTVVDPKDNLIFEYGVTDEEIESAVLTVIPEIENLDLSAIEGCGRFTVKGTDDDTMYYVTVNISDTVSPTADIISYDILRGEKITDDDIVKNVIDHSAVDIEFLSRADFETVGEHTVKIRLTDAYGNIAEYTSYIRIHDINKDVTTEIQSSNSTLVDLIFNDEWSESNLVFHNNRVLNGLGLGKHEIILKGKYNSIIVNIELVDTTPPTISGLKNITLKVGQSCNYGYGVTAWDSVWGTLKVNVDSSAVDINTPGTYSLVYTATDGSGNTAKETVTVTVTAPTRVCLDVTNIMQKPALPNGCEVVSLAIVLKYAGFSVDPVTLYDKFMPKSPFKNGDPWTTYVGDAKGKGYGCYTPCVVTTGNAYLVSVGSSKTVSDVSGQSFSFYESLIDNGIPVIMWGTVEMNGNSKVCWEATINGKYVKWHNYSHCLVLIGYTDDSYIFCDPLSGVVEYTKSSVETSFEVNYKQACIVM